MGLLYLAAGGLGFATLAWGVDENADEAVLLALALAGLLFGSVLLALAQRLPERYKLAVLSAGPVLASAAVLAYGRADSPYLLFYVWVGVDAWFFLRGREALALTVATALVSAAVMARVEHASDAFAWWLMVVGSVVALSALVGLLQARSRRLIERFADAAARDALTGLLNRRGYDERLAGELARAQRYGTPLSIVVGDLDRFKLLNDRYGHRSGDEALQRFAEVCTEQLRDVDFVSRVGGEEFALVLPNTDAGGAMLAAERLRRAIRAALRTPDGEPLTASFGVASYPQDGDDAEVLIDRADQAMYAAKAMGRDRTVSFTRDLPDHQEATGRQNHLQALLRLAETLDSRDDAGARAHSNRVAALCERIADNLGLPPEEVRRVRIAGLLHDIGKIGVPDHVLRKPGRLTPAEWAEMRKHPELGARMIAGAGLEEVGDWVLAHHERPDGRGYPYQLVEDQIPLQALILSVADAYEAMTADRPHRRAPGERFAREQLVAGAGTQFDARVVTALLSTPTLRAVA